MTKQTFEKAMEELQNTLQRLEDGEDNLDQNIKNFKRGLELAETCQKKLDEAELSVKKIEDSGSSVKEVPAPDLEEEDD